MWCNNLLSRYSQSNVIFIATIIIMMMVTQRSVAFSVMRSTKRVVEVVPPLHIRWMSSSSSTFTTQDLSIQNTTLGSDEGKVLLDGLDVYSVPASADGHPLAVYGINSSDNDKKDDDDDMKRPPILLLHGRTWSSIPVYHLLGGSNRNNGSVDSSSEGDSSRSLMEALYDAGLQPYAMDFRGFGGTPRDATGFVDPKRCVADTETVLKFIHNSCRGKMPTLLGWSQGALVAQLVAQKSPHLLSKLTLYGSIYNPNIFYPRNPLYIEQDDQIPSNIINTYDAAIEDFTIEGSIPPETAKSFAKAALITDPIKAQWNYLHEFNNCDPARVLVPTLLVRTYIHPCHYQFPIIFFILYSYCLQFYSTMVSLYYIHI